MNSFENNRRFVVWIMIVPLVATLIIMIGLASPGGAPDSSTAGQQIAGAVPAQSTDPGQSIFEQQCNACHTIGGGKLVGPDLEGVTAQRDRDWLIQWITEPDKMLAQGDPIATQLLQEYQQVPMPNLGLSQSDAEATLAYIEAQSGSEGQAQTGEAATSGQASAQQTAVQPPAGDPVIGKNYFTGAKRFQNGGSSCIACHSVTGIGALGGGTMGPDLTNAYSKFGEAGLVGFVQNPPTQTMNAVWAQKPLTPQEIAHLVAFLKAGAASDMHRPSNAIGQLVLLAGLGGLLFLGVIQFTWRKRLTEVRRSLTGDERLES